MFSVREIFKYISFLKDSLWYNVGSEYFFDEFIKSSLNLFKNMFYLQVFISCMIGIISCMNIFRIFSYSAFPIVNAENFVPASILTASLMEVIPVFIFMLHLGLSSIPISMQTCRRRIEGRFEFLTSLKVNAVAYAALTNILSTLIVVPMIVTFCCLFILLAAAFSCFFFSDVDVLSFMHGYVSFLNGRYIFFCFLKTTFLCVVGSSIAPYIGYFYVLKEAEDISSVGVKCFFVCCLFFLACDFVFNVLFFLF